MSLSIQTVVRFFILMVSAALTPSFAKGSIPKSPLKSATSLPIAFESNKGQFANDVRFFLRGEKFHLALADNEAIFSTAATVEHSSNPGDAPGMIRMKLRGANPKMRASPVGQSMFKTNYLVGADTSRHITEIPNHERVAYHDVYKGIDMVFYGNHTEVEYDFIVKPGSNPAQIKLQFSGADAAVINKEGDLLLMMRGSQVVHRKPVAYQDDAGQRLPVVATYAMQEDGTVKFAVGIYDKSKVLVIDPILSYSTPIKGSIQGFNAPESSARDLAVDSAGNSYIVGRTDVVGMSTTGVYQASIAGTADGYVMKIDPTGTKVLYTTYFGSRRTTTYIEKVAVDATGAVVFAGQMDGCALPVTTGAYQTTCTMTSSFVSFVAKLNPAGSALIFATYLKSANVYDIAVDSSANIFLAGKGVIGFVTTPGAFQPVCKNAWGGPFVAKLAATGKAMLYATFLSGASNSDSASAVAVDATGHAYVTGHAFSRDYPLVNPLRAYSGGESDAFLTKLNPSGTGLIYSSYLGGAASDYGTAVFVDKKGQVHVAGNTSSDDFPTTDGAAMSRKPFAGLKGSSGFVSKVSAAGDSLLFSTFLGSNGCDPQRLYCVTSTSDHIVSVGADAMGYVYVAGAFSQGLPHIDPIVEFGGYAPDGGRKIPGVVKLTPGGKQFIYSSIFGRYSATFPNVPGASLAPNGAMYVLANDDGGMSYPTKGALLASGRSFIFKVVGGKYPTTVKSSAVSISAGIFVTLTANVESLTPGGRVVFKSGTNILGEVVVADGTASFTTNALPSGHHLLTATYSVDNVASPIVHLTVSPP